MCVRCEEMAAEVERLQGLIDDANAQEPLTTIQVLQGYPHVVSHSQCGVKDGTYKVYASPIRAQQSPAVAVPEKTLEDQLMSASPELVAMLTNSAPWSDCCTKCHAETGWSVTETKFLARIGDKNIHLCHHHYSEISEKLLALLQA